MFLTVELKSVAGVGTALEAGHDVVAGREHVHYLAFSLVAPLQAEKHV